MGFKFDSLRFITVIGISRHTSEDLNLNALASQIGSELVEQLACRRKIRREKLTDDRQTARGAGLTKGTIPAGQDACTRDPTLEE